MFIEENDTIHPIEIKKYSVIDKASLNRGKGGIVCMCEEVMPINSDNCFIPNNII